MSYLSDLLGSAYKEGMTEEEISEALESVKSSEITKLKNALSKSNAEAADYKKQLRAKQTADEVAEAERKAELERITKENADMTKQISIMKFSTALVEKGYDAELATATATAMIDGDMDTVLANQSKYLDAQKVAIKAELMKNTPRPGAGGGDGKIDYSAKINEAQASGNFAEVAYYTRLSQQVTGD